MIMAKNPKTGKHDRKSAPIFSNQNLTKGLEELQDNIEKEFGAIINDEHQWHTKK